ncbi:MAG: hypothetical protein IT317_13370 [Anaerolineales bacterium]|nr:hypothetical protein [Anaerolineales bacterium]
MKPETVLEVIGLGLRAAEAALSRRPKLDLPDTRADRLVRRMLPLAERALDRLAPAAGTVTPKVAAARERRRAAAGRRRRRSTLAPLVIGALSAAAAAYVVAQEQQRIRDRYRPLRAAFPAELLEVLAAPGGGRRLDYDGRLLTDSATSAHYALLDGIPDFIAPPASPAEQLEADDSYVQDLLRPLGLALAGRSHAGNAAFCGAVASRAGAGWVLSVPAGRGTYEIEMARANPRARVLCLSNKWDVLLEIRRRGRLAGLNNLYYVRGTPRLLPVQDQVIDGLWSNGLQRYAAPERELTQMVRAVRLNAPVAGVALIDDGAPFTNLVVQAGRRYLPGLRSTAALTALLLAAGVKDLRTARDGSFLRFSGVRA